MSQYKRQSIVARFVQNGSPAINNKYYLPYNPVINASITRGLIIPEPGNEISSTFNLLNANAPLTAAQLRNAFLTLCDDKGNEIHSKLCLYTFIPSENNGIFRDMFNKKIDVSKSFIQFSDVTGLSAANSYLLIDFLIS